MSRAAALLVCTILCSCEIAGYPFYIPIRDPGVLWVANSADNTVTCIDRKNDTAVGTWTVGPNPSRTAVDLEGNCWVGSRGDDSVWYD